MLTHKMEQRARAEASGHSSSSSSSSSSTFRHGPHFGASIATNCRLTSYDYGARCGQPRLP